LNIVSAERYTPYAGVVGIMLHQGFLKKTEKKLARLFNITFRYMCDVLSLNISKFGEYVGICSNELDINDTTEFFILLYG
jgi:hypothetical protein